MEKKYNFHMKRMLIKFSPLLTKLLSHVNDLQRQICQCLQHLELGKGRDPSTGSWESDGQDSMGAGAEEENLGVSPTAQGLAVQGFLWLKTQE